MKRISFLIVLMICSGAHANTRMEREKRFLELSHVMALRGDRLMEFKQLVESGININAKDKDGNTALMNLFQHQFMDNFLAADYLLSRPELDLTVRNNKGETILLTVPGMAELGMIMREMGKRGISENQMK